MATIQVILAGQLRTTIHDTFDYPIVLQFNDKRNYDEAEWVIPSYPRHIPAGRLSEIRVQEGNVTVLVDGPEGFRHGPFPFTWVRSYYPRGHHCSFVKVDPLLSFRENLLRKNRLSLFRLQLRWPKKFPKRKKNLRISEHSRTMMNRPQR